MDDRIPITAAERIGKDHGYDQVIIFARRANDDDTAINLEWVTTWGKNKLHCDIAARIGDAIRANVAPEIDRLNNERDALKGQVEAMREALEAIADTGDEENEWDGTDKFIAARETARAALANPPEPVKEA